MNYGESKARGHGSVDSVAAGAQDFNAGIGSKMVNADHHAVLGADRLLLKVGREIRDHVFLALLRGGKSGKRKCGAGEDGQDGEWVASGHGVQTG
jgi:hypothetical protein